jgi:DHA2 family multidrug resistance protein
MAPVGVFAILLSPIIGKILPKVDARKIASLAFFVFAIVFFMRARFNTEVDTMSLMIPTLIQGAAMAMFFIPLTSIILSGQAPHKMPAASGLSNFVRIMFGAMGASIMTTMWDSRSTMHHAHITEAIGSGSAAFQQSMQTMQQAGLPESAAYAVMERTISVQASTMAATDLFYLAGFIFLGLIGLVWLTKPKKSATPVDAGGAH